MLSNDVAVTPRESVLAYRTHRASSAIKNTKKKLVLLFDLYSYVLASTRLESEFYAVGSGLAEGESRQS